MAQRRLGSKQFFFVHFVPENEGRSVGPRRVRVTCVTSWNKVGCWTSRVES